MVVIMARHFHHKSEIICYKITLVHFVLFFSQLNEDYSTLLVSLLKLYGTGTEWPFQQPYIWFETVWYEMIIAWFNLHQDQCMIDLDLHK